MKIGCFLLDFVADKYKICVDRVHIDRSDWRFEEAGPVLLPVAQGDIEMVFTSPFVADVAAQNIDLAIEGLATLNGSEPPDDQARDKLEWAHFLCTYARYVYLNTCAGQESASRVQEEFIPELVRAEANIARLIERRQELGFTKRQVKSIRRFTENIGMRVEGLRELL